MSHVVGGGSLGSPKWVVLAVALSALLASGPALAGPALAAPSQAKAPARARVAAAPAPAPKAPAKRSGPVRADELAIQAKATEYDGPGHTYKVSGDVHLEVRDLKVTCGEAVIHLSGDDDKVVRIVFTGDVVALRGRSTFRGDRVTYNVATRKLLAEGNTRTRVILPSSAPQSHK